MRRRPAVAGQQPRLASLLCSRLCLSEQELQRDPAFLNPYAVERMASSLGVDLAGSLLRQPTAAPAGDYRELRRQQNASYSRVCHGCIEKKVPAQLVVAHSPFWLPERWVVGDGR